jgi:hypothetical protein
MTAVPHETAPQPTAPWVLPGSYTVSLTTGGKIFSQPLEVRMDPRLQTSAADLARQFQLSQALYELRRKLLPIGKTFDELLSEVAKAKEPKPETKALRQKLETLADPRAVRAGQPLEFDLLSKTARLFGELQQADAAPTAEQENAAAALQKEAPEVEAHWQEILRAAQQAGLAPAST